MDSPAAENWHWPRGDAEVGVAASSCRLGRRSRLFNHLLFFWCAVVELPAYGRLLLQLFRLGGTKSIFRAVPKPGGLSRAFHFRIAPLSQVKIVVALNL